MFVSQELLSKWQPLLEDESAPAITDKYKKGVIARLLENQEVAQKQAGVVLTEAGTGEVPANVQGNQQYYDPVMIGLVRRAMPNLIAYDICGVQPMSGPTGLIFAMRPKFVNADGSLGAEAFYNEAPSGFSGDREVQDGTSPSVLNDTPAGAYDYGRGMSTAEAERLSTTAGEKFQEMGFEIEKVTVTAKSRALKAQYSVELAQDLKQIHGLDAETELASILSAEILAEINREVIRTVYSVAVQGGQNADLATAGTFDLDTDSNGRWSVEKFKGLMFQLERESNRIAQETRRGKGNIMICSSDVASALAMAGMLDTGVALKGGMALDVDDAGNTFAGVLNGRFKVYIDPYHIGENFAVVGYKGANAYDAGLFYAPYVPLQMFKAVADDSFQPKIGFKTRYGMVANPFAEGTNKGLGRLVANTNKYYRRLKITSLTGAAA